MNEQEKQVLRTAAERLLAVADGKTLEWGDGRDVDICLGHSVALWGSHRVRIRPPAAPPEPKPSQAVIEACKRLGVEAWKLGRYKAGDRTLYPGAIHDDGTDGYAKYEDFRIEVAPVDQTPDSTARYWHVRPIAQAKLPELPAEYAPHPMGERKPELPCPPRPTPEQVAAARMPDGRKVKPPTVCEVPNGRAYFNASDSAFVTMLTKPDERFGQRRWIAEPAEDVVTPWALDPKHAGKVVVRKTDGWWGIIQHGTSAHFSVSGCGLIAPAELLRDYTHNGQPCGEVQP